MVKINNILSNELSLKHSMPRSTVLDPLLFIIYIIGLHNQNIDGEILCFTGDTAIKFVDCLNSIENKINVG